MSDTPSSTESKSADALDAAVRLARLREQMFEQHARPRIAHYHVLRTIGQGGMGMVFAAWDPSLDRVVAIKVLRDATSPRAGARLREEAMALAKLRHPNVVAVYEAGEHEGRVYIAMELVTGRLLRAWVGKWRDDGRELGALLDVFGQAAAGLAAAHAAGLVHRDVKPENMMIDADGRARLMDFGLARTEGSDEVTEPSARAPPQHAITTLRSDYGTPAYMAPEQLAGRVPGPAADQFALCLCLFEAAYGRRARPEGPIDGTVPVAVPYERGVARGLVAVLRRGLAQDPKDRFPSVAALRDALAALRRARARRRTAVLGVGVAALGLGVGVALAGRSSVDCTAELSSAWDEARRDELRDAFARLGGDDGRELAPRVEAELDRHAAAWSTMYEESCRATFVHREQSERLFDARMRCLERRRNRASAAVDAMLASQNELDLVERSVAVFKLPTLASCADLDRLAEAPVDDPESRDRMAEQRRMLDRAAASYDVGDYAIAVELSDAVAREAARLGARALQAEALVWKGRTQLASAAPQLAEPTLREAILIAAEAGDRQSEAIAWPELMMSIAFQGAPARGLDHELAARAAVARSGDPIAHAWLLNDLGVVYAESGDSEQALAHLRDAVAAKQRALGPDHVDVGISWQNLATTLAGVDAHTEARDALRETRRIFLATVGPTHPWITFVDGTECLVLFNERNPAAIDVCSATHDRMVAADVAPMWHVRVGFNLARALWHAGRHDEALEIGRRTRAEATDRDARTAADLDEWLADPAATERRWSAP